MMFLCLATICVIAFLALYTCAKFRIFENLLSRHFIFDPKELDQIVKKAVEKYPNHFPVSLGPLKHGKEETSVCEITDLARDWIRETPDMDGKYILTSENPDTIFERRCQYILEQLCEKYPNYCSDVKTMNFFDSKKMKEQWMFNMCGGALGHICVFHFSFTEYIILYGTPVGTSGYSGRYMMDVYDFIIQGHHETYTPGNIRGLYYKPGDMTFLPRFEACSYKSAPHTYMMEYGRGFPGVVLGACYPLMSALFTTLDFYSFYHQIKVVSGHMMKNWFSNRKF
ncbi:hypothetical protein C9374_014412 [Naegleria lovaniensis]|uniref:Uncharacterized protein n=1 Tax=Naegleria lovaniensis TaxID=51637 RepID=A0AA88GXS5_NAELO|nr:uncharacterized protein C9374_014412 [Naegleria lovaniensis]KAG2389012.1 hypothetical protein C9374_014412 [Naegleria lovaniensis]